MNTSTNNSEDKKKTTLSAKDNSVDNKNKASKVESKGNSATEAKMDSKPEKKGTLKKNRQPFIISFLLVIAVSASVLAVYDFWLLQQQSSANIAANAEVEAHFSAVESRLQQFEQNVENTKEQLSSEIDARKQLQLEQQAAINAVQSISEKLGRSTEAWRMAEVEYLLTVANHRLTLAQDRQTAISVFETADSRLQTIADPALLKVRKKIASEVAALRAVPNVDIPGIAVQLGSMAEAVEQLPLVDKKRVQVATEKSQSKNELEWREIPEAVWNDVKSLVVVRRHQKVIEPLLPPKEAWFLYQNLELKLEQAKLFALQKNSVLFAQTLSDVSQWLTDYFDVESAAVISMQESIAKLKKIDLQPAIPDVSGSLRELRAVMNNRAETKLSAANDAKSAKVASQ